MRKNLIQQRLALSEQSHKIFSASICKKLMALPAYPSANKIGAYLNFKNEVDLTPFFQSVWQENKTLYLPVVTDYEQHTMAFALFNEGDQLVKNRYGINEPENKNELIGAHELDFVVVPMVGFQEDGARLGTGAGFYDRAFEENQHAFLCGVAFECQKTTFEVHLWDVAMDCVVTEEKTYF